jgi:serine/threonine-protein kinase RsbW
LSRLRLTINSDLRDVVLIGLAVNKICEHLQMDEVEAYRVELCAVEAATNAIRHAYSNQPGNEVSITLAVHGKRLEVEVADNGLAMLAAQVARLSHGSEVLDFDPADRSSLPEGGMGLQIMREVMDEISYQTDGEVNRLRLTRVLEDAGRIHAGGSEGNRDE